MSALEIVLHFPYQAASGSPLPFENKISWLLSTFKKLKCQKSIVMAKYTLQYGYHHLQLHIDTSRTTDSTKELTHLTEVDTPQRRSVTYKRFLRIRKVNHL